MKNIFSFKYQILSKSVGNTLKHMQGLYIYYIYVIDPVLIIFKPFIKIKILFIFNNKIIQLFIILITFVKNLNKKKKLQYNNIFDIFQL